VGVVLDGATGVLCRATRPRNSPLARAAPDVLPSAGRRTRQRARLAVGALRLWRRRRHWRDYWLQLLTKRHGCLLVATTIRKRDAGLSNL
jgi:hypothetical protein